MISSSTTSMVIDNSGSVRSCSSIRSTSSESESRRPSKYSRMLASVATKCPVTASCSSLVQARTLHTATNTVVKTSANPAGGYPQLVQPSVISRKVLAIFNFFPALELVIPGNQLTIALGKLVQAMFQALQLTVSEIVQRRSG